MNDRSHHFERDDEPLLRHMREHDRAQPSSALDARVLAAAADAARAPSASAPGVWQRLLNGMEGAPGRRRWSAAFGCLALLGLGLGLTFNTLDQVPQGYDAPPATLQRQAPAPMALQAPPNPAASSVMAESAEAPRVVARMAAKVAPLSEEVLVALREIAELQVRGDGEEVDQRITRLKAEYPGLDIEAELARLHER